MTRTGPIRRLAIANRGEAAMRCVRAVKALRAAEGETLEAVALYTEIDRDAPFVRHADLAVALPSPRGEVAAYLDHDGLVEALRRVRADAVWPGWGFVAEDPAFVERLDQEGILFLGPSPEAMRGLGDKIGAKQRAEKAGVPVTPWSGGALSGPEEAAEHAERIGYPVVVKATAGGGGRGIRVVDQPDALAEAFRSAASEARSAFGDDRLFLEKKVEAGRHVEVQIAADAHGHVYALGCRDCSVQRRHQKVVEEAPPPGLAPELIQALQASAVRIAEGVQYQGVGTVEFLVEEDDFYFLEMNPRLQVEHGITEETTGADLVQLQIRIARGEPIDHLADPRRRTPSGAAIEVRVCAEDPDAGFLPAPGRIARFDPALGPGIRIDTGVAAGSTVPSAFDSLVAKVIAKGRDRDEARARLAAALADFDLVVEGGATNKGWLLEILDHPDFRRGGVTTTWLDGFASPRGAERDFAAEALVAAAILSYQRRRALARLNFYSDLSNLSTTRIPPSAGQQIDLSCEGQSYRLQVYAVGSWRYRVHLDGRVVMATLREEGAHTALLGVGGHALRVAYDVGEAGLRLEVEGRVHSFDAQAAGQVRAGAPAVVVAIDVEPGDRVEAGQRLGLLEAMKMEVGFDAPVSGVVKEVRVRRGEQAAAGDVLLVIDPSRESDGASGSAPRLQLDEEPDPLQPLFRIADGDRFAEPDLAAASRFPEDVRRDAILAVREEVRRVLLGYDANSERAERLVRLLEAPLPDDLPEAFRADLTGLRHEIVLFADVARLFVRAPASVSGEPQPSNSARLRMYVRRVRAAGAGVSEEFLALVRRALSHYGIPSLEPSDALERALLRMLAAPLMSELRDRLVLGVLRRLAGLGGADFASDRELAEALDTIAGMRGLVADAVADAATEARHVIFERPTIEQQAERATKQVEVWLDAVEAQPAALPESVLLQLAHAPRALFERVGRWLADADPHRRSLALAAHRQRIYAPRVPEQRGSFTESGLRIERSDLLDGRVTLAASCEPDDVTRTAGALTRAAEAERGRSGIEAVDGIDLLVPVAADASLPEPQELAAGLGGLAAGRFTLSWVCEGAPDRHWTFAPGPEGARYLAELHEIHPETAERVGLGRLGRFDLERLPAGENLYCFHARSRELPADERLFVLAELRTPWPQDEHEVGPHVSAFEHLFFEATRTLRGALRERDPKRRLQWNRIQIDVAHELFLEGELAERLARRLAPATRNLGLEKVVVRLRLLDRALPGRPAEPTEVVISDVTGDNMTIQLREPHHALLSPRTEYERKLAEARRRRLAHPFEIVRMLTGGEATNGGAAFPAGVFEEYDLDASGAPVSVAGRTAGDNRAGIVFGVVTTPTDKVPEGMRRVLVLSDPTRGMGSLAGPECDRLVAALDLAAAEGVPLEWIAVSSGARIAMDSGTENLDATARVVRRIVEFTQAGGTIHVVVAGVNVGAQSYWNALATMLMHTNGALIMTPGASMVLTGRAALEASGAVSAEDEQAIGGFERVMGPNGEAQYLASDLREACRILYEHYRFTYVVPGEPGPRPLPTRDPVERTLAAEPCDAEGFERVGEIFDDEANPGRKRPFPMRPVMRAVIDRDGGWLERWRSWSGAETAIVWDAHLGGHPVCLIGIESRSLPREGYRPSDGPDSWTGGTLFPLSSKKVARALNAASGNRPAVILANLSGFDGSPESMRKLQLEYGAEIARAVVNFRGPIVFLVVSRYHGGAYVVFSRALNPRLRAAALSGSYASVIGGAPAAAVVFAREVRARAAADPRVRALRDRRHAGEDARERYDVTFAEVALEKQAELASEFDGIHTVERAREVGSLEEIVEPDAMRAWLVRTLEQELEGGG